MQEQKRKNGLTPHCPSASCQLPYRAKRLIEGIVTCARNLRRGRYDFLGTTGKRGVRGEGGTYGDSKCPPLELHTSGRLRVSMYELASINVMLITAIFDS